ncbi:baeRF2 domain-containing protein [Streptomyces chiangmaiensis]|uniref:Vms1/Ankzf1 family peptidyl-tRNA hydrolase n=1 Tax=Streptomyces chiangmaiensis TaxID=766497 RepID=A0ABU7FFS3_9ACTN|nr:Vms1/Ankzf1 family peptidyl-tRNA hydrolase [Streptomyces chiangmaiensis]MED7821979.1 Vms1/Ankzf1 family peptidyl-tRNA hydrolase [Streptomyces chiangmaiensis]
MDLAYLHPLYEHPGPWASVYVDTSRHIESTPHERTLTAQTLARDLEWQGADEQTCRAVRNAVEELAHFPEPHGRALFARAGEVVLDPPLAAVPGGSSASWASLPHTAPLLDLANEEPVCVVAYIDRKGAEFELRGALGSKEAGKATGQGWPLHRTTTGDWSVRHFQLRVENIWEHNAAEIADALAVCQEETGADLVILVGEQRERRSVHERLPNRLQDRVAEASHGPGSRLLDENVERIRAAHVRARAAEELERFLAARAPDDEGRSRAVEGVPAVVEAAREHCIDELLINPDGSDTRRKVWIGGDPDQVAVRRGDLTGLGERHPEQARADDALLRAVVETGAAAISVPTTPPGEAPEGGVGALLRWA